VELGFRVPRSSSGSSAFLGEHEPGRRGTPKNPEEPEVPEELRGTPLNRVIDQLNEYFSCKRQTFDLELAPRGTPFQLAVWNALLEIPYGETISYAELARRIGKPAAVRAVGAANGANPIPVIIPCHRVIGSNGTLTGYGGGIERKQWLLVHEGRRLF
jgi:methylated-DNA-[protein]-cysteine S-methyltransferase